MINSKQYKDGKTNSETTAIEKKQTTGMKYFSSLHSTPLTIKDESIDVKNVPVGALVSCQAVVDWAYQRFPLSLTNVLVETPPPPPPPPLHQLQQKKMEMNNRNNKNKNKNRTRTRNGEYERSWEGIVSS